MIIQFRSSYPCAICKDILGQLNNTLNFERSLSCEKVKFTFH